MPQQLLIRGGQPGNPPSVPVECGATGATVANSGPWPVYYRDEAPVSAFVNDGSVASGSSVTLYGAQYLTVDRGDFASPADTATLFVSEAPAPVSAVSAVDLDLLARFPSGADMAVPGVLGPPTAQGGSGNVTLVAGTEYRVRCVIPRTMKLTSVSFTVRTAAGADDATFVSLRDSQGNLLATRATGATGIMTSATRRTVSFDSAVVVEAGSIVYACLLIPTFGSTAPAVWGWNPAVSAPFQLNGLALGQIDAGSKTGLATPPASMSAADIGGLTPYLFVNDQWGLPVRAWENPNLTTISPFVFFDGLSQGSQLSFVTDTVRVAGTRAMKAVVRPGDVESGTSTSGERCEISQLPYNEKSGDAFWYSISTYLPPDYVHPSRISPTVAWAYIMQLHTLTSSPPGPVLAINVRPSGIYLDRSGGEISGSGLTTALFERAINWMCAPTQGAWHDFVLRIEHGATGGIDVFHRLGTEQHFTRVWTERGRPTMVWANGAASSTAGDNYARIGLYRSAELITNTVYQAGLRRGRALADVMGLFGSPQSTL